jgi:ribosomal protein S18 acetylase RimI-like enzyme
MNSFKLILILLISVIYIYADKINIISHDTFNNDLAYQNKNNETKIAFLKNKQLENFVQLFLENSKNLYNGHDPEKFIDYMIKNKDQHIWGCNFKNKLNILTCTVNKDLAGFICFIQQTEDCKSFKLITQLDKSKSGYIALLCVNKAYRQHNIGTLLISSAVEELFLKEQVRYITVLTALNNLPAQNLFIKMGFEKINEDFIKNKAVYKIINNN